MSTKNIVSIDHVQKLDQVMREFEKYEAHKHNLIQFVIYGHTKFLGIVFTNVLEDHLNYSFDQWKSVMQPLVADRFRVIGEFWGWDARAALSEATGVPVDDLKKIITKIGQSFGGEILDYCHVLNQYDYTILGTEFSICHHILEQEDFIVDFKADDFIAFYEELFEKPYDFSLGQMSFIDFFRKYIIECYSEPFEDYIALRSIQ